MYERMMNKSETPTMEQMTLYCGESAVMFTELNEWLSVEFATVQTVVFPYGNNYGWGPIRKKVTLSAMYFLKTVRLQSCCECQIISLRLYMSSLANMPKNTLKN